MSILRTLALWLRGGVSEIRTCCERSWICQDTHFRLFVVEVQAFHYGVVDDTQHFHDARSSAALHAWMVAAATERVRAARQVHRLQKRDKQRRKIRSGCRRK